MPALTHLDATVGLFDPDCRGECVRYGRRQQRFGSRECRRLVLEEQRDAAGPVSDRAIAQRLAHKGLDPSQRLGPVQKTALAVLRRLASKGVARAVAPADFHAPKPGDATDPRSRSGHLKRQRHSHVLARAPTGVLLTFRPHRGLAD